MGAEFYSALPANPPADLALIIDNRELREQIGLTDQDLKKYNLIALILMLMTLILLQWFMLDINLVSLLIN